MIVIKLLPVFLLFAIVAAIATSNYTEDQKQCTANTLARANQVIRACHDRAAQANPYFCARRQASHWCGSEGNSIKSSNLKKCGMKLSLTFLRGLRIPECDGTKGIWMGLRSANPVAMCRDDTFLNNALDAEKQCIEKNSDQHEFQCQKERAELECKFTRHSGLAEYDNQCLGKSPSTYRRTKPVISKECTPTSDNKTPNGKKLIAEVAPEENEQ